MPPKGYTVVTVKEEAAQALLKWNLDVQAKLGRRVTLSVALQMALGTAQHHISDYNTEEDSEMDFVTFSTIVAGLQTVAVHTMTPEGFAAFTESISQMRADGLPPKEMVKHLTSAVSDAVKVL